MTRRRLAHSWQAEVEAARPLRQAAPYRHTLRDHLRDVREIIGGMAVILTWLAAGWLWLAILTAGAS